MGEKVLALDISTKTGWACLFSSEEGLSVVDYGQLPQMPEPKDVSYPSSYVIWAQAIFDQLKTLIVKFFPTVLVIEETASGSKSNYSQKILEFIHYLVADFIKTHNVPTRYFMTEEWRRICGCKMSKEESQHNKEVREYKRRNKARLAKNKDGKVIGRIGRKHINVRRANEIFDDQLREKLRMKDEDTADALLLGAAYHLLKNKRETKSSLQGLRDGKSI